MNLSLDEIMAQSKGRNGRKSGPLKGNKRAERVNKNGKPYTERQHKSIQLVKSRNLNVILDRKGHNEIVKPTASWSVQKPITTASSGSGSILDRVGLVEKKVVPGTKITFANLNRDITDKDIVELCETVGEIHSANIIRDRRNVSTGTAEAIFLKMSDANTAVVKFNGLTLDGVPLHVKLAGKDGKENPFDPLASSIYAGQKSAKPKNVRIGLFGTAGTVDEDDEEQADFSNLIAAVISKQSTSGPKFTVRLDSEGNNIKARRDIKREVKKSVGQDQSRRNQGGKNERMRGKPLSVDALDVDLDAYMSRDVKNISNASGDLDADLDSYFAKKK